MANTATAGDAGKTTAGQIAHDFWGWMLARGLLAIALGIVAIMWPLSALFAFTSCSRLMPSPTARSR